MGKEQIFAYFAIWKHRKNQDAPCSRPGWGQPGTMRQNFMRLFFVSIEVFSFRA